ncbi:hypothetical protein E5676_scaffold244G00500 [Cucumis melo var. makuwa]|uniref:Uncharacterized protein n=1 Tax=Cucumis melo var. makuwa TaxID=1194695 RepID=A0A5D3DUU5_CUCMM|nr:hypothetical protein E5676_scaffold244G00500 [Cucumis melo var. makuwa]
MNQSTTDRLYLKSCILLWANRRLCQFPSPPYATRCSLEESIRSEYRYWNKTWNYLSFLEGVRELTIESLGFTTGLIGDSSPLLGWIRLDEDLNEILATSQLYVWGSAPYRHGILRDHETDMITRLLCVSFGIMRLICASFGITTLICASDEITRLIDVRYGEGQTDEGQEGCVKAISTRLVLFMLPLIFVLEDPFRANNVDIYSRSSPPTLIFNLFSPLLRRRRSVEPLSSPCVSFDEAQSPPSRISLSIGQIFLIVKFGSRLVERFMSRLRSPISVDRQPSQLLSVLRLPQTRENTPVAQASLFSFVLSSAA